MVKQNKNQGPFDYSDDLEETKDKNETKRQIFNSAIATLETLTAISRQDTMVSISTDIRPQIKQQKRIDLLKSYLRQAICLKPSKFDEDMRKDIFKLQPTSFTFVKGGTIHNKLIFDYDLEIIINDFINKINTILNQEGFFVPPVGSSYNF